MHEHTFGTGHFWHKSLCKLRSGPIGRRRELDQSCAPSARPAGPAPYSGPTFGPTLGSSSDPAGAAVAASKPVRSGPDGTADTKVPAGHAGPAGPAGPAFDCDA
jgi:hypothetical protein